MLLTGFALWAALSHIRFLFFAGLVIMPIIAPRLELFPPYEAELDKRWLNAGIIVAVAAAVIFFFPTEARLQQKVDQTFPKNALQFMQEHQLHGRIFNRYAWGGYMEWNRRSLSHSLMAARTSSSTTACFAISCAQLPLRIRLES